MDTEEQPDVNEKIRMLGSLGYTARQCFNVLQLPDSQYDSFISDFDNKKSDFHKQYEIGVDIANFEIDSILFQLAKTGDIKALTEYERRKLNHQKFRK